MHPNSHCRFFPTRRAQTLLVDVAHVRAALIDRSSSQGSKRGLRIRNADHGAGASMTWIKAENLAKENRVNGGVDVSESVRVRS